MVEEMPNSPPESLIFALLSKRPRRQVLRVLQESSTPLTVEELAARIEERELETRTDTHQHNISHSLYHNHLPRLDTADVVAYEESEGTVAPDLNFDTITRVLNDVSEDDLPWSTG